MEVMIPSMGCIFVKMFRYHIDKLAELNIILGYVLSIQELKIKEANMRCWYVLANKKTGLQHIKAFLCFFFIIN